MIYPEPESVGLLRSPGIDSQAWRPLYDNPLSRTGPPGNIGWRNRFLGSLNVYKFLSRIWDRAGGCVGSAVCNAIITELLKAMSILIVIGLVNSIVTKILGRYGS
jgi:hypothetical protein